MLFLRKKKISERHWDLFSSWFSLKSLLIWDRPQQDFTRSLCWYIKVFEIRTILCGGKRIFKVSSSVVTLQLHLLCVLERALQIPQQCSLSERLWKLLLAAAGSQSRTDFLTFPPSFPPASGSSSPLGCPADSSVSPVPCGLALVHNRGLSPFVFKDRTEWLCLGLRSL